MSGAQFGDLPNLLTHQNYNWSNIAPTLQDTYQILSRYFGENAYIIKCLHPNFSNSNKNEILSILLNITQGIANILSSSGELLKPVIAIINRPDFAYLGRNTMCVRKKCHYQLLVILPARYENSSGEEIKNSRESIYLIDPCSPNKVLHSVMKYLFKNEISFWYLDPKSNLPLDVSYGGFFKNADSIDENIVKNKLNLKCRCDCPYISIYVAIMLVKSGNPLFLNEIYGLDINEIGAKLRHMFEKYQVYEYQDITWQEPISEQLIEAFKIKIQETVFSLPLEDRNRDDEELKIAFKDLQICESKGIESKIIFETPQQGSIMNRMQKQPQSDLKVVKKRTFSIQENDFEQMIVLFDGFVDKSMFIYNVFAHHSKRILLTRPRKWGKTLNLQMLKTFIEIEKDPQQFSDKKRLFEGGIIHLENNQTKILNALKVWEIDHGEFVNHNFGKYPVVFVSFADAIINYCITERKVVKFLWFSIRNAYEQHRYIYKKALTRTLSVYNCIRKEKFETSNENMSDKDMYDYYKQLGLPTNTTIDTFYRYLEKDYSGYTLNDFLRETQCWLEFLIDFVYDEYKMPVCVLVDEYDALINNSFEAPWFSQLYEVAMDIFMACKYPKVYIAVITGISAYTVDFSNQFISKFERCGVLDSFNFQEDFGFTEFELKKLCKENLEDFSDDNIEKEIENFKSWYNGYCIGNTMIFNPFSTISCLHKASEENAKIFNYYWAHSGFHSESHSKLINYFKALINSDDIRELLNTQKITRDLSALDRSILPSYMNENNSEFLNFFVFLLLDTGYLTTVPKEKDSYAFPNAEVREVFYMDLIGEWLKWNTTGNISCENKDKILEIVNSIDYDNEFVYVINEILKTFRPGKACENDFQVLLGAATCAAMIMGLNVNHYLFTEKRVGRKSIDAFFMPIKGRSTTVVIHEYKLIESDTESHKNKALENAIWQLYANQYLDAAIYRGKEDHCSKVITRGIVFYRESIDNKWKMVMKTFTHSIEEAQIINDKFSDISLNEIPHKECLIGTGKQNEVDGARESFLTINGKSRDIFDFLDNNFRSLKRGRISVELDRQIISISPRQEFGQNK